MPTIPQTIDAKTNQRETLSLYVTRFVSTPAFSGESALAAASFMVVVLVDGAEGEPVRLIEVALSPTEDEEDE